MRLSFELKIIGELRTAIIFFGKYFLISFQFSTDRRGQKKLYLKAGGQQW